MAIQRRFQSADPNLAQQMTPALGGGLLGLTQPNFGSVFTGQNGLLQQGMLGDMLGKGFGGLFGGAGGLVDFGGGNFFQPGQGFFQQAAGPIANAGAAAGQIPTAPGFNLGNFFGSLFGG